MKQRRGEVKSLKKLLSQLDLARRRRYIKKEFQAYGLQLADELNDWPHRSLYIRLAKTMPRKILERARLFIKDQNRRQIKNRARLFMWKLKQLRLEKAKVENKDGKNDNPPPRRRHKH